MCLYLLSVFILKLSDGHSQNVMQCLTNMEIDFSKLSNSRHYKVKGSKNLQVRHTSWERREKKKTGNVKDCRLIKLTFRIKSEGKVAEKKNHGIKIIWENSWK